MSLILSKEQAEELLKSVQICKEILSKKPVENITINININDNSKQKIEDAVKMIIDKINLKNKLY